MAIFSFYNLASYLLILNEQNINITKIKHIIKLIMKHNTIYHHFINM